MVQRPCLAVLQATSAHSDRHHRTFWPQHMDRRLRGVVKVITIQKKKKSRPRGIAFGKHAKQRG